MFFHFKSSFLVLGAILLERVALSASLSDDELIDMHSRLLSDTEMEDFHRELGQKRCHQWWNSLRDSWSPSLRGSSNSDATGGANTDSNSGQQQRQEQGFNGGTRGGWGGGSGPSGGGGGGGGGGGLTSDEMAVVDYLLDHRQWIVRSPTELRRDGELFGMELKTTSISPDPKLALKIQEHVHQMHDLVLAERMVRQRDPLYAELLSGRHEITMEVTNLDDGVSVTETGETLCAAELVRAHSEAVDGFVEFGRAEVRANHDVPAVCLN